MSVDRDYYVITGYDLTKYKTNKYRDWRWTDEGQSYTNCQRRGQIQLFDDPMANRYLYLGYVLGAGNEYEFNAIKTDIIELECLQLKVEEALNHLSDIGVIDIEFENVDYELIVFEECT